MPLSEESLYMRSKAIGGSDAPHLMNLKPYGCIRRLWYDKKGIAADHPFRGNNATRRGDVMEEVARVEYFERTARAVCKPRWKEHPRIPYFGCHADGLQEIEECGPKSILEIKCPSARVFYAIRQAEDPPNEAWVQAQWCMNVHELEMGTVLVFCADSWEQKFWDFPRDAGLADDMAALGIDFWSQVQKKADNPFPKLPDGDRRCGKCPWRGRCKGLGPEDGPDPAEDAAMAAANPIVFENPALAEEAMLEFVAARARLEDAETVMSLAKARLQGIFPRNGKIVTPIGTATLARINRKGYTAEVKATAYQSLRVVPAKEVEETIYDREIDDF